MSGFGDKFREMLVQRPKPNAELMKRVGAKILPPKTDEERAADEASAKRNATKAELIGVRG